MVHRYNVERYWSIMLMKLNYVNIGLLRAAMCRTYGEVSGLTACSVQLFNARQNMLSALNAIACPSVRLSVCLSARHTGGSVENG